MFEQAECVRAELAELPNGKRGAKHRARLITELERLTGLLDDLGWDE